MEQIKIQIKSFDVALVESATKKVITAIKNSKKTFSGPIPLPTKREIFTILRSVHVNKKSREQFELRTHKRLIVVKNADATFRNILRNMELPSGIQIDLKIEAKKKNN